MRWLLLLVLAVGACEVGWTQTDDTTTKDDWQVENKGIGSPAVSATSGADAGTHD